MACGSRYSTMFSRLVANTTEPENEQSCWVWTGKRDSWWYGRLNVYVPGLRKIVTVMAHIAAWVGHEANPQDADEFWLAYQEFVLSGLELDHLCEMPACVFVDHLEPVTPSENCKRRDARRAQRVFAPRVI